jgi:D-lactate dehydrogenase (cytochrome)
MLIGRFQALQELREALGDDAVSVDKHDLLAHGFSEYSSINIDTNPAAVAYPKSTEDVSKIAKICHKYKVPMSELLHDFSSLN